MAALPDPTESLTGADLEAFRHMAGARAHADGRAAIGEVYVRMFNAPAVARRVGALGELLSFGGVLPGDVRELVIVRYAARQRFAYEWAHHQRPAELEGLDPATVAVMAGDELPDGLRDDQAVALAAVDAVVAHRSIPADVQERIVAVHGLAGVVEIVALCGLYALMGYTVSAFDIPRRLASAALGERPRAGTLAQRRGRLHGPGVLQHLSSERHRAADGSRVRAPSRRCCRECRPSSGRRSPDAAGNPTGCSWMERDSPHGPHAPRSRVNEPRRTTTRDRSDARDQVPVAPLPVAPDHQVGDRHDRRPHDAAAPEKQDHPDVVELGMSRRPDDQAHKVGDACHGRDQAGDIEPGMCAPLRREVPQRDDVEPCGQGEVRHGDDDDLDLRQHPPSVN